MNKKPLLILDPGHGGKDPGGGSNKYWKEKDMVLAISLYQLERFRELGVPVVITRDRDIYLSPSERTSIVKESGAKYCVSNHINAGGGDGAEVIKSVWDNTDIAKVMAKYIRDVGQNIRRVFTRTLPNNPRTDYYFMHRETGAVNTYIVEYGFADSKKDDVEQLKNNWKKYAEAVVKYWCIKLNCTYVSPTKEDSFINNNESSDIKKSIKKIGLKETIKILSKMIERGEL